MNPIDQRLDRLLKAAAAARPQPPAQAPYPVQTRILNQAWRTPETADDWILLLPVIRLAVWCACVIALAALAFGFLELDPAGSEEAVLLQSQVSLEDLP